LLPAGLQVDEICKSFELGADSHAAIADRRASRTRFSPQTQRYETRMRLLPEPGFLEQAARRSGWLHVQCLLRMDLRKLCLLGFGVLMICTLPAQVPERLASDMHEKYVSIHQNGEIALLKEKYKEALGHFRKVTGAYPDFIPALRGIGACYEMLGDHRKAADAYLLILEKNPRFSRALYFEAARTFYQCGEYAKARSLFETYRSMLDLEPSYFSYNGVEELAVEEKYFRLVEGSIFACTVALDSLQFRSIGSVTNLGDPINSAGDEYFPCLTNDGRTLYYTYRRNDKSDEDLYRSTNSKGSWRTGQVVEDFNTGENEGMPTLVKDGRRLFFTACQRPETLGPCDIWEADLSNGQLRNPRPAPGDANSMNWESQASVSCDGSALYFASNRIGGFGGADIWVSYRREDGLWGRPQNLGPHINSAGDEEAPFISNDGKVLFFSSTGHLGFGEQDIFLSRMKTDGGWGLPLNLGVPVNSAFRELGFFLSADGRTGYFASNRTDGFGGMDIYQFQLPEALRGDDMTYVAGKVMDSITQLPVRTVVHFDGRPPVETDADGSFFLCLSAPDSLALMVRHPDYHPYRKGFSVPVWDNRSYFQLNILLDPLFKLTNWQNPLPVEAEPKPGLRGNKEQILELRHAILFDFDGADLRPDDIIQLDTFLAKLIDAGLVEDVEIIGYADQIGRDAYNLKLSEKRARNVGIYMKDKGVSVKKVYIEGKGESINEQPNWKNRRVEIIARYVPPDK
jgi:tetratricopeptide (TPR) repeat protein